MIDGIDQHTQLVGQSYLEMLLFRLGTKQKFAINVFKVKEAIPCPRPTKIPNSHPAVRGVAYLRGKTISIFDLAMSGTFNNTMMEKVGVDKFIPKFSPDDFRMK